MPIQVAAPFLPYINITEPAMVVCRSLSPIDPFHMMSRTFRSDSKQWMITSASSLPAQWNAMEFTQSLLHLPEIRLNNVQ